MRTAVRPGAKWSVLLFLGAVVMITMLGLSLACGPISWWMESRKAQHGLFNLADHPGGHSIDTFCFEGQAGRGGRGSVMKAGVVAVISILGIAWLGSTFFESHQTEILGAISAYVSSIRGSSRWRFSVVDSALQPGSDGGGVDAVGLQLGFAPPLLIAMFPAAVYFFCCRPMPRSSPHSVRLYGDDRHRPMGAEP